MIASGTHRRGIATGDIKGRYPIPSLPCICCHCLHRAMMSFAAACDNGVITSPPIRTVSPNPPRDCCRSPRSPKMVSLSFAPSMVIVPRQPTQYVATGRGNSRLMGSRHRQPPVSTVSLSPAAMIVSSPSPTKNGLSSPKPSMKSSPSPPSMVCCRDHVDCACRYRQLTLVVIVCRKDRIRCLATVN